MAESRDPNTAPGDPSPYLRLPTAAVATGLFVVLAAALAFGVFANQNLRSTPGIQSSPTVLAGPTLLTASTPPAPTPTTRPTVSSVVFTAVPLATAVEVPPTPTASASIAGVEPVVRNASPELTREIDEAYEHYWRVRADALLDLDTAHLTEVMAGDHLISAERLIAQLRAEGHAIRTDVDHHYVIVKASAQSAEIADTYTDNSVYVDAQSHAVIGEPTNDVLREKYTLERIEGGWRVVSLVRAT